MCDENNGFLLRGIVGVYSPFLCDFFISFYTFTLNYIKMEIAQLHKLFLKSSGISIDTRSFKKNELFFALHGENFDGNKYAQKAIELGAKYAIIDNPDYFLDDSKTILVKDTLATLQKIANYHRKKLNLLILAITGTNGKTTTKELVNAVLSQKYKVLATAGNYNNHIGVPLTLLKIKDLHQIGIIEMGANHPGEIKKLCEIAEPDYGIITNIGKAHLDGFGSFDGVISTKKELYDYLSKNDKKAIFYHRDDDILKKILPENIPVYSYGLKNSDISGEIIQSNLNLEMKWRNPEEKRDNVLRTHLFGAYNFYNILAAIRIGVFFKVDSSNINMAISDYSPQNKRSQVYFSKNNEIILDAYNANPVSMKNAIESFAQIIGDKKKLAILGDMFELGKYASEEHKNIISLSDYYPEVRFVFVGKEFCKQKIDHALFFCHKHELIEWLKNNEIKGKSILVKGSRGMQLEDLIDLL